MSSEIERDKQLAVVAFDSANAEFFLAHYDIAADPAPLDTLRPAVTISAIRGRARAAGSEFVLATDIRFASRERAVLGQFEVGFASVPGGGPSTRLPGIVGRGRAFEILLGGDDFGGDLAERYGYVNRAVPDADFAGFVDEFAQRVAGFDLLALADIKRFINDASLPADDPLTAEMDAFADAAARPATTSIIEQAFAEGFQQRSDLELNLGSYIANLVAKPSTLPLR